MKVSEIAGLRVGEYEGPLLSSERDALNVIGAAFGEGTAWIVIPAGCLAPDFFRLSTRIAGEFIQKFVNYGHRLAILGDISAHVEKSDALRDFVRETNKGHQVWFLPNREDFEARLRS